MTEELLDVSYMKGIVAHEFDVDFYLTQVPELKATDIDPIEHYLTKGWRQGLDPSPKFSTNFYLEAYPDVKETGIQPFFHFIGYGRDEGRAGAREEQPLMESSQGVNFDHEILTIKPYFDPEYYIDQFPSLQGETEETIIQHFVSHGWQRGLDPSPAFSTTFYLEHNPDVAVANINPIYHYYLSGIHESREISPSRLKPISQRIKDQELPKGEMELAVRTPVAEPVEPADLDEAGETAVSVRAIAFFRPDYVPKSPEDPIGSGGEAIWNAVASATPAFKGHYQPHFPFDFGFYDLRVREVCEDLVLSARGAGLSGFCFYYTPAKSHATVDRILSTFRSDPAGTFPFCLCVDNEVSNAVLDGDRAFFDEIAGFLTDPRHVRINDKPVLLVSRRDRLREPGASVRNWRRWAQALGLPGLYIGYLMTSETDTDLNGFDAAIEAPWRHRSAEVAAADVEEVAETFRGVLLDYDLIAKRSLGGKVKSGVLRSLFPSWDETPCKGEEAAIVVGATTQGYEFWLRGLVEQSRLKTKKDDQLVFIHAWNDWRSGAHLEPDLKHQKAWLEATQRALTKKTQPEILFSLIAERVERVKNVDERAKLKDAISRIERELRALTITEAYFETEKIVNDRLAVERSRSTFKKVDLPALLGPKVETSFNFRLETMNGRPLKSQSIIVAAVTNALRGWAVAEGVFPESVTTQRLLLLRRISTEETFGARIIKAEERNDVAKFFDKVDRRYTQFAGFSNVFSFAEIPPDIYGIGFAVKSDYKAYMTWSNLTIRLAE